MATPIKETPILYGEDSDRFLKEIAENEGERATIGEREKALILLSKKSIKRF